jgi:hypothetical protein
LEDNVIELREQQYEDVLDCIDELAGACLEIIKDRDGWKEVAELNEQSAIELAKELEVSRLWSEELARANEHMATNLAAKLREIENLKLEYRQRFGEPRAVERPAWCEEADCPIPTAFLEWLQ